MELAAREILSQSPDGFGEESKEMKVDTRSRRQELTSRSAAAKVRDCSVWVDISPVKGHLDPRIQRSFIEHRGLYRSGTREQPLKHPPQGNGSSGFEKTCIPPQVQET